MVRSGAHSLDGIGAWTVDGGNHASEQAAEVGSFTATDPDRAAATGTWRPLIDHRRPWCEMAPRASSATQQRMAPATT
jgi:hypothetical protein